MAIASIMESNRLGTVQTVAAGASTATVTNPFGAYTNLIRVVANTACHIKVVEAAGGAAATTDSYLPANWIEYIRVTPGQKISAIQAATGGLVTGTAGTVWVTELSA
jgi:hypothetical protein